MQKELHRLGAPLYGCRFLLVLLTKFYHGTSECVQTRGEVALSGRGVPLHKGEVI